MSIAGQPGGVEAARVKIRVSWNSAMFVLKEPPPKHSSVCTFNLCGVGLDFWELVFEFSADQFLQGEQSITASSRVFAKYMAAVVFAHTTLVTLSNLSEAMCFAR